MAATYQQFVEGLIQCRILPESKKDGLLALRGTGDETAATFKLADQLAAKGAMTKFQAAVIYQGMAKDLLLVDYLILDKIGEGSMGIVYKAVHRNMNRIVALKILSPVIARNEIGVKRFLREVRAVAQLLHPNIVTAFDAGTADGRNYLALEYVNGVDLSKLVDREGPRTVREGVDYILQVARGLEYAHAKGVIHRDIKPANLLRDVSGTIKILDMGLARLNSGVNAEPFSLASGGETPETFATQSGFLLGTAGFMAPEQARDSKLADHRSDIYSLGCTLFYLLTGKMPYEAASAFDVVLAHRDLPIPSLSAEVLDVPSRLETIYQKMMQKDPGHRYQSIAELIVHLEASTSDEDSLSTTTEMEVTGEYKNSSFDLEVPNSNIPKNSTTVLPPTKASATPKTATGEKKKSKSSQSESPVATRKGVPIWVAIVAVFVTFAATLFIAKFLF